MRSYPAIRTILCLLFLLNGTAFGYSTHTTSISRTFDQDEAFLSEEIAVTVRFTNEEIYDLRGFYHTEHIPDGLSVNTVSVKIDGEGISDYVLESGSNGEVYAGSIPYRWVLETPINFAENNPISEDSTLEIVYSITPSQPGAFNFDEFGWVGYYQDAAEGERAAFGHSEDADRQSITFEVQGNGDNEGDSNGGGSRDGCFIATAAFGSPRDPRIVLLREFRDRFLLTNTAGKSFVRLYYRYSPPIADFMTMHDNLQAVVRLALLPLIGVSYLFVYLSPGPAVSLMLLVLAATAAIVVRHRRRT